MNAGAREGDIVKILFVRAPFIRGTITHTPQTTGDSWVIVTKDGTIYNVQNYECMRVEYREIENQVKSYKLKE